MKLCKKSFLFLVGIITLAADEVEKAVLEAVEAVDQQSVKIKERVSNNNAK